MAINYSLTISDPNNLLTNDSSLVFKDLDYVMSYLSQYITFQQPLNLQIVVKPSLDNPFHTDGLLPSIPAWTSYNGQITLAAMVKGQTGIDPNGTTPDAGFTVYLGNDGTVRNYGDPVWFDPNPQLGVIPSVPNGSADFISIAIHELVHCFGFAAWPEVNAPWNQHTILQGGVWEYSSPAINAILGGPLPLDPNERPGQAGDHIGNTAIAYQPVMSDLMYEWGNYANNRWDIGQVDLLILKDLGWSIQNYQTLPLVDPLDKFDLVGTSGNDIIQVSKFSSIVAAGLGDDTVVLPAGIGNGNYLIEGGSGTDKIQLSQLSTQFNILSYGNDFLLQSKDGSQGVSLLNGVESISFSDKIIVLTPPIEVISATTIQNDYLGIVRLALPLTLATAVAGAIQLGTSTEAQYVGGLLSQVANTTFPAVAVEGSMYGASGTLAEVTLLATQFLPGQVASAVQNGFNAQVYASEALGLAFAFGNETGGHAFGNAFGPSNTTMPNSAVGDATYAVAAANAIFGSASTPNLASVIQSFVTNWKTFYTSNGIPGISNASSDQVDLAARGATWGDAVGIALANELGPLKAQAANFLMDAAQGIAIYSASLVGQPAHFPFQGEIS